ncbi:hypothetical protein FB45DRAFT_993476 [Roridomyces roridus]|uniref:Uncharacterized protein n=1 Tax=Roridomyces roridus TaxID=1738132 RepID=A0AAD7B5L5_9AGAR|nr:hypothetical protein FB45DRAFT_993476 [Roridomyces roridus]
MSEPASTSSTPSASTRGRGKSRGGLGKYLRARGRGRGLGRPAEFGQRLLLDGEAPSTQDDEEAAERAAELAEKFSRRRLGTNADRYVEPEPEPDSDGEPVVEPEVDLSAFLEKQRISDTVGPGVTPENDVDDEDDVDHNLDHISSGGLKPVRSRKGKVEEIEWDDEFNDLEREKVSAEAIWDLKSRFRAKSEKLRKSNVTAGREPKPGTIVVEAPPLPLPDGSLPPPKGHKEEMQDFLDDLLG